MIPKPPQVAMPEQLMVAEFHRVFEIPIRETPTIIPDHEAKLRMTLMREELEELGDAIRSNTLTHIAKELTDLLYVVLGTGVQYGLNLKPLFAEVHRSNMSKVGGHKRADGKWVKPPTYSPAELGSILETASPIAGAPQDAKEEHLS